MPFQSRTRRFMPRSRRHFGDDLLVIDKLLRDVLSFHYPSLRKSHGANGLIGEVSGKRWESVTYGSRHERFFSTALFSKTFKSRIQVRNCDFKPINGFFQSKNVFVARPTNQFPPDKAINSVPIISHYQSLIDICEY